MVMRLKQKALVVLASNRRVKPGYADWLRSCRFTGKSAGNFYDPLTTSCRSYGLKWGSFRSAKTSNQPEPNRAPAFWTAAALCRSSPADLATPKRRGLPHSKTSRNFPAAPDIRHAKFIFTHHLVTHHANAFTVASKLAASATFSIVADLSMRFMKPLNAVPGPSSMNRV